MRDGSLRKGSAAYLLPTAVVVYGAFGGTLLVGLTVSVDSHAAEPRPFLPRGPVFLLFFFFFFFPRTPRPRFVFLALACRRPARRIKVAGSSTLTQAALLVVDGRAAPLGQRDHPPTSVVFNPDMSRHSGSPLSTRHALCTGLRTA